LTHIIEVLPYWPAEIFINRHILSFTGMDFQLDIVTKRIDNSLQSASLTKKTNIIPKELPKFYGLNKFEKALKAFSLYNQPDILFGKRSWPDKLYLKYFRENKPDLIHFHWTNLAIKMSWIPLELGIPFTFSMRGHDVQDLTIDDSYIESLKRVIQTSAGIHSVCDSIWKRAVKLCQLEESIKKHRTIYTTVPIQPLIQKNKKQNKPYIFVTTGRLHWRKNYKDLLSAFSKLLSKGLDAKLIIVGGGEEEVCLKYWAMFFGIEDHVTFSGTLSYQEIMNVFAHTDAYIQSSIAEGLSNSLAEAMAVGLPVFATGVGGTSEIIKDSINGFILDPIHPENWWEKLILIKDRELMSDIGTQAFHDAKVIFSAKKHAQDFINFYYKSMEV